MVSRDISLLFKKKNNTNEDENIDRKKIKRKPGRPKGSVNGCNKNPTVRRYKGSKKDVEAANKAFAFDWCYRNNFDLVGFARHQFIFRDRKKTWLVYEKPYDEETPYIPSEIPVSHVKDY